MQTGWSATNGWQRFSLRAGVVLLAASVLGLPINDLVKYTLLLAVVVTAFAGTVSSQGARWLGAIVLAAAVVAGHILFPAPRIDEGFNVFVPPQSAAGKTGLPDSVLRDLTAQFERQYPQNGCAGRDANCAVKGRDASMNGFAFSADALYDTAEFSRRVAGIRFSDPAWLRPGVINELAHNWPDDTSNIRRLERDRHSLNILDRFRITYPLVIAWRFPLDFAGSELCWRGILFWPKADGAYEPQAHNDMVCRPIRTEDAGRTMYAASILHDTQLSVNLRATWTVQLRRLLEIGLSVIGIIGLGVLLIRVEPRRIILPALFIGITAVLAFVIDNHFIGGFRPLDGGDDGIVYEGLGRTIVRDLIAGNLVEALRGGESVYFFTPGFRYFRAFERLVFGDTYLAYFSTMLLLPFLVLALARRFLPDSWALGFMLLFIATPVGVIYGSTFADYITTASRGYADSFAYFLLFAGLITIIPRRDALRPHATSAFLGAFLLAMSTFCRPNIVLVSVPFLACASLIELRRRHFVWIAALLLGYATLAVSPLHNYVFGHSLVPFSDNAITRETMRVLPSEYLRAALAMITLDFSNPLIPQAFTQAGHWLGGTHNQLWTAPFNAAGFAVLIYVALFGRAFDPWLRAIAFATLLLHGIGICYVSYTRYNLATWLLTALVSAVWWQQVGLALLMRWQPELCARVAGSASWQCAGTRFARLQEVLDFPGASRSTRSVAAR